MTGNQNKWNKITNFAKNKGYYDNRGSKSYHTR